MIENFFKKIFVVSLLVLNISLVANDDFTPFVKSQLEIIKQMDNDSITQEEMLLLLCFEIMSRSCAK